MNSGDDVLRIAKQHWRSQIGGEMSYVDVPEWGDGDVPLRIYYRPISLREQDEIYKAQGSLETLAVSLIARARNEDGSPMFRKVHKGQIMRDTDPAVVGRILEEMSRANDEPSVEDMEKN